MILDRFNYKVRTMLPGGEIVDGLGTPILVKVETEIYKSRFMGIPYGGWQEALEYTYTLQVCKDLIALRCWDTTNYYHLFGQERFNIEMGPAKVWGSHYNLLSGYHSASAIGLIDDIRTHYNIYPPESDCRSVIAYLHRLPLTTRLQFVEQEVRNAKVFWHEKLGRATRTKE